MIASPFPLWLEALREVLRVAVYLLRLEQAFHSTPKVQDVNNQERLGVYVWLNLVKATAQSREVVFSLVIGDGRERWWDWRRNGFFKILVFMILVEAFI